jgi:catechol 2,3-dioxygenase-like lactoylglutathione lyase family enzyme
MNTNAVSAFGFVQVKAIALAVSDAERAKRFYGETLGLPPASDPEMGLAFMLGDVYLLLKLQEDWYGKPMEELNARITLEAQDAFATEKALVAKGVTISDPVTLYGKHPVGAFLDSEGNKLWFCSETA